MFKAFIVVSECFRILNIFILAGAHGHPMFKTDTCDGE